MSKPPPLVDLQDARIKGLEATNAHLAGLVLALLDRKPAAPRPQETWDEQPERGRFNAESADIGERLPIGLRWEDLVRGMHSKVDE